MGFVERRLSKDDDIAQPWVENKAIKKDTPSLSFIGVEAGAKEFAIIESAGKKIIRNVSDAFDEIVIDPATRTTVRLNLTAGGVALEAHAGRHAFGGEDALGDDALRFGQINKVFGTGSSVTIDAGATYTLPKGIFYVFLGANTRAEVYDDVGALWKIVIAVGGNGLVISDGTNVRLNNVGTAAEASNMRPIL